MVPSADSMLMMLRRNIVVVFAYISVDAMDVSALVESPHAIIPPPRFFYLLSLAKMVVYTVDET